MLILAIARSHTLPQLHIMHLLIELRKRNAIGKL